MSETMTAVEQLRALARKLPGVAANREAVRDVDKQLRASLAAEIVRLKRAVERVAEREAERRTFTILPLLDRLGAKLDRLANLVRHAGGRHRDLFDSERPSQRKLDQLYELDLQLLAELESLIRRVAAVQEADGGDGAREQKCRALDEAAEAFGEMLAQREHVLGREKIFGEPT